MSTGRIVTRGYGSFGSAAALTVRGYVVVKGLAGQLFTDPDSFGTAVVGRGPTGLAGHLFTDADTFGQALIGKGPAGLVGHLFTDADSFGTALLGKGPAGLGGHLYSDPDSFFQAVIADVGLKQLFGHLYGDADTFFQATVHLAGGVGPPPDVVTGPGGGGIWSDLAYEHAIRAEHAKDARRRRRAEDRLKELFDREWRRVVSHEPEIAEAIAPVLAAVASKKPDRNGEIRPDFGRLARNLDLARAAIDAYAAARERQAAVAARQRQVDEMTGAAIDAAMAKIVADSRAEEDDIEALLMAL